jgi:hypothetical protein
MMFSRYPLKQVVSKTLPPFPSFYSSYLSLCAIGMDHFHINTIKDQFLEEFLGTIDGLDKDQYRGFDAFSYILSQRHHLSRFVAREKELLFDCFCCSVSTQQEAIPLAVIVYGIGLLTWTQ